MPKNPNKNNGKRAATSESPSPEPSSQLTTADLGKQYSEAQQQFEQTTNEANLQAHNTLLNAYRDYAAELQSVQHDLEGHALEVYQKYLANLSQAAGSDTVRKAGSDHYWEFVRLSTELSGPGGWLESAQNAYRDLLKTLAQTANQADSVVQQAEAYRVYVEQLTKCWKDAEPVQRRAEEAYLAHIKEYNEGLTQGQTALESAYRDYLRDLNEAYVRSDFEQRASAATKNYLAKAQEACKQSQSVQADAAKGLIETQENLMRNIQPEQSQKPV